MPSYAIDASTWRDYQPLLGSDMRLDADNLPAESIWAWRGLDVHLDRYGAPEADLTVIICHGAEATAASWRQSAGSSTGSAMRWCSPTCRATD